MKYLSILIILFVVCSCSTTKNTIESTAQPSKDVVIATEMPDAVEAPTITKNKDSIIKISKGEFIIAVKDSTKTDVLKNDTDSIETIENLSSHQNSTKREGYVHDLFNELLQRNVSNDGKVNYKGFKNHYSDLLGYIKVLTMLYPELNNLSKQEKLAYWINVYNALTIDLIIRNYPLKSIKDIKDPWDQRLWKFGDKWQNLNDIEHKILRKMNEPRIHFAIVCASESCPKLLTEAFTGDNLDTQLTKATKRFLSDTSKNEISKNRIKLSKIFKWFKKDFESDGSLIDFLNQYADITISNSAKRSYKDYSWDLNN